MRYVRVIGTAEVRSIGVSPSRNRKRKNDRKAVPSNFARPGPIV